MNKFAIKVYQSRESTGNVFVGWYKEISEESPQIINLAKRKEEGRIFRNLECAKRKANTLKMRYRGADIFFQIKDFDPEEELCLQTGQLVQ